MHNRLAPPPPDVRRFLPLVFAAVLSLTLAGSAHAFTVQIVQPADDPCLLAIDAPQTFEAVAYDGEQEITDLVIWSWDFDDGSGADTDNPTEHAFETAGDYTVTVTATWSAQQEQDTVSANVPPQWVLDSLLYARPFGADFMGYGGSTVFGSEVCDIIELVWEVDIALNWHSFEFYQRNPDGTLTSMASEAPPEVRQPQGGAVYSQGVSPEVHTSGWFPNQTRRYAVKIGEEYGTPDGPDWRYWLKDLEVTSNNTGVEGNFGLIVHHANSGPHQIDWTIDHRDPHATVDDPHTWVAPLFDITVLIRDLAGDLQRELWFLKAALVGPGSEEWDGKISGSDAPEGIYTYEVTAGHEPECEDSDKSPRLVVDVEGFYYVSKDIVAEELTVLVSYFLNRDAGDVQIKFYGPDLEELDTLTGQPALAREDPIWSDLCTLEGVEFDVNGDPIGPYACVVLATETAEDGALNRDEQPKPAVPKGTTDLERIPLFLYLDGARPDEKESVGAFIVFNNDDDNDSETMDADEEGQVVGENDLKRLIVTWDPAVVNTGDLTLKCTAGAGLIGGQVFSLPDRQLPSTLPIVFIDDGVPQKQASYFEYWVEGYDISAALRDVRLELLWERDGMADIYDAVRATVWDAEIDECGPTWMPSGELDDPTEVTAAVQILPAALAGTIRVCLDSTAFPGHCNNAPTDDSEDHFSDPDLMLKAQTGVTLGSETLENLPCWTPCMEGLQGITYQTATTVDPQNEFEATMECRDYGAWGNVVGVVQVADTLKVAHVPEDWCKRNAEYPVDEDRNYIADCWAWNEGEATDDTESLDGKGDPNYPGDGLSRYEEYRGFMALGEHIRTNPDDDKDLFLSDRDDIHGVDGSWADVTASGVTPHCILEEEFWPPAVGDNPEYALPPGRGINFNFQAMVHARDQYALKVIDGGWDDAHLGVSWFYDLPGVESGTPYTCVLIEIFTRRIRWAFGASSSHDLWEDDDVATLRYVFGHEVGHAMRLTGHGVNHGTPGGDPFCVMYSPVSPGNVGHTYCAARCLGEWRLYD